MLGIWALFALVQSVGGAVVDDPKRPLATETERRREARERSGASTERTQPAPLATTPVDARAVAPADPPRLGNGRRAVTNPPADRRTGNSPERLADRTAAPSEPTGSNAAAPRNTAVIAIGLYGNRANVEKNRLRIQQAGYTPWSQTTGRYTRVGIEVTYRDDEELQAVLRRVRSRFAEESFVLSVNGRPTD